ncbi:hypothetical protein Bca52824_063162 [Brassica carinata]|uniref:non-specific serine/threonine protein kinase n=1 Tax=Brassica carinata TaxID=52824 RepID=A0A8X7U7F9_BRACI|nr:hypothetical protein Bca52824_063162 [Brassica carinata]
MMNLGLLGITLLCCLFVSFRIGSVSCLNSDGLALLSLLNHFDKVPPEVNSTWKKNTSEATPCNNWFGVICDDDSGNVKTLNLSGSEVSGQLGSEIGELKSLITLDLSNNSFSGRLPSSLRNCTSLQYLDLSENGFSGEIPVTFGSLKNLTYLYLTSNFFSGELPESLFQLPLLQVLNLDRNNLTGLIPASVGGLKELSDLTLSYNELSGPIPESIGNCSKLEYLYLHKNKLNGSLPESLNLLKNLSEVFVSNNSLGGRIRFGSSNCKKLVTLELSYNDFEGGVPPELGNCSNLDSLLIIKCNLTGNIPSSLGMLRKVTLINLGDNRLSGNIPHELGSCSSLHTLKLNGNQLQGEIPAALGNLKKLQSLELFENKLSGEIPISVWKIQSLTQMVVHNNTLTGELPAEVTELKNLKKLLMFNNSFHGGIPMSLGVNRSLEEVDLIGNSFTGEIPPNLCHGQKLRVFNLNSNQLHGSIPPSVGQCKTLERIWLGGNKLSGVLPEFPDTHSLEFVEIKGNNIEGSIPHSLGSCKNLQTIILSQNKLTGLIPPELGNLQNLQRLYLSHNHLEGPLPSQLSGCVKMLEFDVGSNSLNGSVPSTFSSWKSLTTLVLSNNRFSGAIPPLLAEFGRLIDLQVARNAFEGKIPSSLGLLKHLNSLDLSGNRFTGEIQSFLGGLVVLVRLNISNNKLTGNLSVLQSRSFFQLDVSNNQLTGPIPEMLINSSSVFTGNPSLCIQPSHSVSAVIRKEFKTCKGQAKLSTWMIALIAVGSFLSALALLFALAFVFLFCKRGVKTEDAPVLVDEEEGLSLLLNKVLTATDNLDDKYIIGRGAHGVVYKASLAPGEEYAVKKLIFAEHVHANQNMKREIETIGQVRHRNLVRLERFWIRKENGLMLYKYMPNGSLYDVLHRSNQGETGLDWSTRFNIALGIAHGLQYLHHDCHPPIIHRDIKPENILMDSEMEPHIGDFGLARILDDSTISTATITGTTGYIAPENAYKTVRCKESDVYSYGVVLLELITGKRAVDRSFPEETDIVSWVKSVLSSYEDDDDYTVSQIVDPKLVDELLDTKLREQAILVTDLALVCTDKRPENRPSMRDVMKELTDVKDLGKASLSSSDPTGLDSVRDEPEEGMEDQDEFFIEDFDAAAFVRHDIFVKTPQILRAICFMQLVTGLGSSDHSRKNKRRNMSSLQYGLEMQTWVLM